MKLTNTLRDAFVGAAMNDVPSVDYDPIIRKAVTYAVLAALPEAARKLYADEKTRPYLETAMRYCGTVSVSVPGYGRYGQETQPKLSATVENQLAELAEKRTSQESARETLRRKLKGAAYAATTRKALVEMLPEFEKYLPPDEAAVNRSLPVVANIVADFVKAGWPKGKKLARA